MLLHSKGSESMLEWRKIRQEFDAKTLNLIQLSTQPMILMYTWSHVLTPSFRAPPQCYGVPLSISSSMGSQLWQHYTHPYLCLWVEDNILNGFYVVYLSDVVHPMTDVDALDVCLWDELGGVSDWLPKHSPEELAPGFCLKLSGSSFPLLQDSSYNVRHGWIRELSNIFFSFFFFLDVGLPVQATASKLYLH